MYWMFSMLSVNQLPKIPPWTLKRDLHLQRGTQTELCNLELPSHSSVSQWEERYLSTEIVFRDYALIYKLISQVEGPRRYLIVGRV